MYRISSKIFLLAILSLLSLLPISFDRSYHVDDVYIIKTTITSSDRLFLEAWYPPDIFLRSMSPLIFPPPSDENYIYLFSVKIEYDDDEDDNEYHDDDVEIVRPHCWETTNEMIHRDDNLLMFPPEETSLLFAESGRKKKKKRNKKTKGRKIKEEKERNEIRAIFFLVLFFSFFSIYLFILFLISTN